VKIIAFFPILIGLVLATLGASNIDKAYNSRSWDSTKGIILTSTNSFGSKGGFRLKIEYDYGAYDKAFHGKTVFFGDTLTTRNQDFINRYLARYPMDKEIDVYYDPKSPEVSVIEPGLSKYVFGNFFGGFSLIAAGACLYCFMLIAKNPRRYIALSKAFLLLSIALVLATVWAMRAG
jgi:hypothetical protein